MQSRGVRELLIWLLVAYALTAGVLACGSHGAKQASWDRQLTVKGRQRSLLSMQGRRCGTEPPSDKEIQKLDRLTKLHSAMEAASVEALPTVNGQRIYRIKTYVTIVMLNDGTNLGNVSDAAVRGQLARLNWAYSTSAPRKSSIRWYFDLQRVKRVVGTDMCDTGNEGRMKALHRQGDQGDLNLYITDLSSCGLLGFSTWPWDLKKNNPKQDGVVLHFDTLPVQGRYVPYNMGITAVHEIGHWMGLFHTFQNGCSKGGDLVEDTPYVASPTEGCPAFRDSCPEIGSDPIHNFMDYTDDKCMREFSELQHKRMEMIFPQYRRPLKNLIMTKLPPDPKF